MRIKRGGLAVTPAWLTLGFALHARICAYVSSSTVRVQLIDVAAGTSGLPVMLECVYLKLLGIAMRPVWVTF